MTTGEHGRNRSGLLRARVEGGQRATFMELFFDLVYVFAVTRLSQLLLGHLSVRGAAQTLLLLVAVWRAWVDTAWITDCITRQSDDRSG